MLRIATAGVVGLVLMVVAGNAAAIDPPPCPDTVERVDLEQHVGERIAIAGEFAVMASRGGLSTWDLSEAEAPHYIARWIEEMKSSYLSALRLELDDRGYAYVLEGTYNYWTTLNLEVYDVRDASNPQPIAEIVGDFMDFDVDADRLVVVGSERLGVYDVSDPYHPRLCGSSSGIDGGRSFLRVVLVGETAFVASSTQFLVFDASECAAPELVSSMGHGVSDPRLQGTTLFDGDGLVGMVGYYYGDCWGLIWDVADPEQPVRFSWPQPASAFDVALRGRIAYVATDDGVRMCDLGDPATPEWSGVAGEGRRWGNVEVRGDYLYVLTSYQLRVFDISSVPEEIGGTPNAGALRHFAADGGVGAMARRQYGVTLFDLTPQGAPEIASNLDLGAYANRVEVDGPWLYVGLYDPHGIAIIDVEDPDSPSEVATMQDPSYYAIELAAEGSVLAAGLINLDSEAEIRLIDVSRPDEPRVTFTMELNDWVLGLDVADGFVYLATRGYLVIIDATDPADPFVVSSTWTARTQGTTERGGPLAAIGSLVYIAYTPYVVVVDVSDPLNPSAVHLEANLGVRWLTGSDGVILGGQNGQRAFLTSRDQDGEVAFHSFDVSRESEGGAIVGDHLYIATSMWLEKVHLECRPPEVEFDWHRSGSWVWPEAHVGYGATSGTWDFGFGEPVEWSPFGVDPVHYPAPGAYDITLELANEWGSDRLTKTVIITPELGLSSPIRHPSGRLAP